MFLHICRYWISKAFGPIQQFTKTNGVYYAYIPLPGANASTTSIEWTINNHIDVNVYTRIQKKLGDGAFVNIPCYHHAFVAAPHGSSSDIIRQEWQDGILILSCKM